MLRIVYDVHIVLLADIQRVSKNHPRGPEISKWLIIRETNQVCDVHNT